MAEPFAIEAAAATDLPDIMEILEDINLDMEELHYTQFVLGKHRREVVGAGRIRLHTDGTAELCSLGVMEAFRGCGLGTHISKALLQAFPQRPLWVVSEIPDYFARFGFAPAADYPAVLADKLQRCQTQYACTAAQVMCLQNI